MSEPMEFDDDDPTREKHALMNLLDDDEPPVLGQSRPGTSNTMPITDPVAPVDPSPAASAAPTRTPTQASVFQGFQPRQAMEGFDWNRQQDTGKSAKDAFAFLANQAAEQGHAAPLNDKAALQQWAAQYIVPGMEDLGHHVSNVNGDTFHLNNWQGDFDVDYGRGAGADGGALAWQVQEPTAQMSGGAYTPKAQAQPAAVDTGSDQTSAMDRILAEIQALQNGGASPMDADALMQQLQV